MDHEDNAGGEQYSVGWFRWLYDNHREWLGTNAIKLWEHYLDQSEELSLVYNHWHSPEEMDEVMRELAASKAKATKAEWYDELVDWLRIAHPMVHVDYKERIMAVHDQGARRRERGDT